MYYNRNAKNMANYTAVNMLFLTGGLQLLLTVTETVDASSASSWNTFGDVLRIQVFGHSTDVGVWEDTSPVFIPWDFDKGEERQTQQSGSSDEHLTSLSYNTGVIVFTEHWL